LKWAVDPVADVVTTAGDLIYGTAADTVTRLGIGTAGQFLAVNSGTTAPEWVAAPGGGANWSLLNAGGTALTGAATITISGISGKDKIMVLVINASSASASSTISVRLNTDTGNNYKFYGADYTWGSTYSNGNYETSAETLDAMRLGKTGTSAANIVCGYALITGCNASGVKVFNSFGTGNGTNGRAFIGGGFYNSSSTISSVSLFSDDGNFDAGTIYVYCSA
jgi:hypothetical protein